jgi:O-succinylbenzoate synthase
MPHPQLSEALIDRGFAEREEREAKSVFWARPNLYHHKPHCQKSVMFPFKSVKDYKLNFSSYKIPFRHPLKTSHGVWSIREGIIINLTDDRGKTGQGEIAPLPWFGSETLESALAFCQQFAGSIIEEQIANIPDNLPACQFGFTSALEDLSFLDKKHENSDFTCSYLLPAGEGALTILKELSSETSQKLNQTFKWKIGVEDIKREREIFTKIVNQLSPQSKLRLDANGGLNYYQAQEWLKLADNSGIVEFLEQPLNPQKLNLMLKLSENYTTPLALDESVANIKQLHDRFVDGWRGIFVIKAAIIGSPILLRRFCRQNQIDAVFSSVFESTIGRKAVLRLAAELSNPNRALGFGVEHWF